MSVPPWKSPQMSSMTCHCSPSTPTTAPLLLARRRSFTSCSPQSAWGHLRPPCCAGEKCLHTCPELKLLMGTTESQGGRDHSRSSGPTSLLKQSHPRAHGTGLCPQGSEIIPARDTPLPLWATCHLHRKEVVHQVQVVFPVQALPIASCHIAGHHQATAWLIP